MILHRRLTALVLLLALTAPAFGISLQAVYESAPARDGYDRYLVLETGVVYTGGLLIGATWDDDQQAFLADESGCDVMIEGHGAILDLLGRQICISFCDNRLDIEDCVILNGGVRFRGDLGVDFDRAPAGSVRYCTFYRPRDYAVRLQGAGAGITIERNIVVDAVDTGLDQIIWSGDTGVNLPTGVAFGLSVQTATFGVPDARDNWSWFADSHVNDDDLHHFCFL